MLLHSRTLAIVRGTWPGSWRWHAYAEHQAELRWMGHAAQRTLLLIHLKFSRRRIAENAAEAAALKYLRELERPVEEAVSVG